MIARSTDIWVASSGMIVEHSIKGAAPGKPKAKILSSTVSDLAHITPSPKYSICITNYNTKDTIRESLESILSQVDSSFELVVCDNCSTDGSREILADYANRGKLKLIVQRSNRGRGREIAFENSTGELILSGLDMDDVFKPTLRDILRLYHEKHEGYMLSFDTVHIVPRAVVKEVGGWRDLYWGEDVDFSKRVQSISKWRVVSSDSSALVMKRGSTKKTGQLHKDIKEIYMVYQAKYRIGSPCNIFQDIARRVWYKQLFLFFIAISAMITCQVKGLRKFRYECYECTRCGHKWVPRSLEHTTTCPKCKSAYFARLITTPMRSIPPRVTPLG